jgi:hypothetical protein
VGTPNAEATPDGEVGIPREDAIPAGVATAIDGLDMFKDRSLLTVTPGPDAETSGTEFLGTVCGVFALPTETPIVALFVLDSLETPDEVDPILGRETAGALTIVKLLILSSYKCSTTH